MDKETQNYINEVAEKAADTAVQNAVAKMREFHLDDMKVLGERMDIGFESVNRRIDGVEASLGGRLDRVEERLDRIDTRLDGIDKRLDGIDTRLDKVENALSALLKEFKEHRDKVDSLETQVRELTSRVTVLEKELASVR